MPPPAYQDPKPPDLGKLHSIAFEYHAAVMSHGTRHASGGSIWLDLAARSLRLRGEAKQTKVGPLYMDLIAHGGEEAQVPGWGCVVVTCDVDGLLSPRRQPFASRPLMIGNIETQCRRIGCWRCLCSSSGIGPHVLPQLS